MQMKTFFCSVIIGTTMLAGAFAPATAQLALPAAAESSLDTVKTLFPDGAVSRIYTVKKGSEIREGVSITYHPNGKVAVEAPYKNGKLDGVYRCYFENGNLWQTIGYREDLEEGISTTYYENGKKKKTETYKGGFLHGTSEEFTEQGKLQRRIPYEFGSVSGVAKVFDENGAVKEEMHFKRGLREGPYRRYNKGIKVFEARFEHNRCVENCDF